MHYEMNKDTTYLVGSRSSRIKDEINCFNSDAFLEKGHAYISEIAPGCVCTFDFRDIKYAETSWVATMVDLLKRCKMDSKELVLTNMNDNLHGALNICKLESLFNY